MRGRFSALGASVALLIAPAYLLAKGDTVRIIINGGNLAAPISVNEPAVAARFYVWSNLILDRSRGVVELPKGLQIYNVSFVTTRRNPSTYVLRYAIDPSTNNGYVYIPGKMDIEFSDNVWLIYRGIEGDWFYACSEWKGLAHPLIAKAPNAH